LLGGVVMQWLASPSTKPRNPGENYFRFAFVGVKGPFVKLL